MTKLLVSMEDQNCDEATWAVDPTGRYQYRWWDGEKWTEQVGDDGIQYVDEIGEDEQNTFMRPKQLTHPSELELASLGSRFAAMLADVIIITFSFFIGWLIWQLVISGRGQSPGKQMLSLRVVHLGNKTVPSRTLLLIRESFKHLFFWIFLPVFGFGLIWPGLNAILAARDSNSRTSWDRLISTVVIQDIGGTFNPQDRNR